MQQRYNSRRLHTCCKVGLTAPLNTNPGAGGKSQRKREQRDNRQGAPTGKHTKATQNNDHNPTRKQKKRTKENHGQAPPGSQKPNNTDTKPRQEPEPDPTEANHGPRRTGPKRTQPQPNRTEPKRTTAKPDETTTGPKATARTQPIALKSISALPDCSTLLYCCHAKRMT